MDTKTILWLLTLKVIKTLLPFIEPPGGPNKMDLKIYRSFLHFLKANLFFIVSQFQGRFYLITMHGRESYLFSKERGMRHACLQPPKLLP